MTSFLLVSYRIPSFLEKVAHWRGQNRKAIQDNLKPFDLQQTKLLVKKPITAIGCSLKSPNNNNPVNCL